MHAFKKPVLKVEIIMACSYEMAAMMLINNDTNAVTIRFLAISQLSVEFLTMIQAGF